MVCQESQIAPAYIFEIDTGNLPNIFRTWHRMLPGQQVGAGPPQPAQPTGITPGAGVFA